MFETGIRQFRMAMAMVNGRRIKPQIIQRLVADADATLREFGSPGDDVDQLLDGPFADPDTRTHFQTQGLRRTARRLAKRSPFYAARFAEAGLDPKTVDLDSISSVPVTTKADLVEHAAEFVCTDSRPYLSTRTTGTTGAPAEIWLSRYEAELWPAMAALSGLLRNEINHTDCLQINLSSRATAAVQHDIEVCRLVGARSRALGLVPVDQSIDGLLDHGDGNAATILGTYPSYLARLVTAARRRGLGPDDFALRRIDVAGEMLSHAVATAARDTFGVRPSDTFAMTEVLPVSGRTCGQGHLHLDLNMGLVEVIALDGAGTGRTRRARHDGRHPVLPLSRLHAGVPLRHPRRRAPPPRRTAHLQPRRRPRPVAHPRQSRASCSPPTTGLVTPRDIVEVLEALPAEPWPAQYRASHERRRPPTHRSVGHRRRHDHRRDRPPLRRPRHRLRHRRLTDTDEPLRHVRADLAETTFTTDRTPAGV